MRRALIAVSAVLLLSLATVIPAAAAPSGAATCGATYTVTWGDTINKIAAKCGVTVSALLQANPTITNPNRIFGGQKLNIPGGTTPPPGTGTTTYVVRAGDTLIKIAARFGTTVANIRAANPGITNANRIFVGQRLVIPAKSPPVFAQIEIALIALEQGNIGCNDGVVMVKRTVAPTTAPLTAAIKDLLSIKDQYYGQSGLYNALYQSNLQVQSVVINAGKATIKLTGTTALGGVCDAPRVQAQFDYTARQFSTVQTVEVFVNGRPLADILSSAG